LRNRVISIIGAAVVAGVLAGTAGAAKTKTFHFTDVTTGAQISGTQSVFKVKDTREGSGAGVQTVKIAANGTSGTDKETTYYGDASATSKGSFTIGTPDPVTGIAPLSGKGKDTGGTGKLKGFTSTYTYTGTFNTKTLIYKVTIHGTGSLK
jgi:hypothetical protein